jgi:hypothetical protein
MLASAAPAKKAGARTGDYESMSYRQFTVCLAMAMTMFGASTLRDLERLLNSGAGERRTA